eukprot:TRINITY_DN4511_c0_g1_i1.p1 TRINITY_DN4511_c0_g1~~TRINITY_DN4511_c0_g1_i1.p1  ORF type:complete len:275 (-),score=65.38 TRINITY_DN4511_c0_g1_i1:13-837(-)
MLLSSTFRRWLLHEAVGIINTNHVNTKISRTLQLTNHVLRRNQLDQTILGNYALQLQETLHPVDHLPAFPGRPDLPKRVDDPAQIPKAHLLNPPMTPNAYILHAIAHIELNAVELYWDTMVRFDHKLEDELPGSFFEEISSVLNDEASHFELCRTRLEALGTSYGACPVHNKQWERANEPKELQEDIKARLVILSLVQEARGLDASPRFIRKLKSMGDKESAEIVDKICNDEINHVGFGMRWFEWLCTRDGIPPIGEFHRISPKNCKKISRHGW